MSDGKCPDIYDCRFNPSEFKSLANNRLRLKNAALEADNERLKKILAKEVSENDELGSEFVYVNALRDRLKAAENLLERAQGELSCSDCMGLAGDDWCADYEKFKGEK